MFIFPCLSIYITCSTVGVKNERAISAALAAYGGALPLTDFISLAKKFPVLLRPVQFLQKRLRDQTLGEERWLELSLQSSSKLAVTTTHATAAARTSISTSNTAVSDHYSLPSNNSRGGSTNINPSASDVSKKEGNNPLMMGTKGTDIGQGLGLGKEQGQGVGTGPSKVLSDSKAATAAVGDTTVVRTIHR